MNLLLDTSAFLWFASGSDRLPAPLRAILREPEHSVWLSVVSMWEIVVKQQLGRLPLPAPAWPYLTSLRERHDVDSLALEERALQHLPKLPALHRDPFDRMLICQAIEHDLQLVTNDDQIRRYPVKTMWMP